MAKERQRDTKYSKKLRSLVYWFYKILTESHPLCNNISHNNLDNS